MKLQIDQAGKRHLHADCRFCALGWVDYLLAISNLVSAKIIGVVNINFHLPYEIQFRSYKNEMVGKKYIKFVCFWAKIIGVRVVWENTAILNSKDWSVVENSSDVPKGVDLCLDIGHLMLGAKSKKEARAWIASFFGKHQNRIQLLHLHVNDLRIDKHQNNLDEVVKFLGVELFERITKDKDFILEP